MFEPLAGSTAPGDVVPFERYASTHKALASLGDGGSLFLVTVRPPDEQLWLVGILDAPVLKKDGWYATNATPIANITASIPKLAFSTGKGLAAKPGALAMSLQTPRVLTGDDVEVLRAAAGGPRGSGRRSTKRTSARKRANATATNPASARKPANATTATNPTSARKPANATTATNSTSARKPANAKRSTPSPVAAATSARATRKLDLSAIATALDAEDAAAALDAALAVWRQTRATALADLVDTISSKLTGARFEDEHAWSAAARGRDAAELGPLLAATPALPASFLPHAGEALAAYPDDPRIAHAVATWALDPPTTSSSTYAFWTKALDAMARAGDARVLPLLEKRLKQAPGGSQFWPKFYKAIAKAIAATEGIAGVERAAVDDKAIAKLAKTASQLAAHAPAKAKASTLATAAPKVAGTPLAQAVAHLAAARVGPAIEALVAAWRAHGRGTAIADLVDRATRLLPSYDRALGLDDKAVQAAWDHAFANEPQAALPQLLDNLLVGGPKVGERHLVELASLPDDPRVAMRLAMICSETTVSPERTQFWKSTLELLARIADPRVAPALCTTFDDFTGDYYNHHRQARRILGGWAQNPPAPPALGPKEQAELARAAEKLARLEAKHDSTERALLAAIADAWDDPAPRLVYADWLTEQQHPRGEVLVLANKAARSAAEDKRLRELLRKTTNLYGLLDHVGSIYGDDRDLGLEHGLPTQLSVHWNASPLFWRALVGYPLLATVAELAFDDNPNLPAPEDFARVLRDPTARRLAKVRAAPQDFWTRVKPHVDGKWKQRGNDLVRA